MNKVIDCLWLMVLACALFGGAASADEPEKREATDSTYRVALYLTEDKERLNQVKFGAYAEQIREQCPLCAFIADNSDDYVWLALTIEWDEETDLSAFDMDLSARIGERWYQMRDLILPLRKEGKMDFVRLDDVNRLAPGRYPGGAVAGEADPNKAVALVSFKRTKRFDLDKIEEIQFTADKEARPLQK